MARDHHKLRVFTLADALTLDVYRVSKGFPADERFGLLSQLRRSALSAASNIVEGSARKTTREYVNFLNQANGSAAEAQYLLTVASRLSYARAIDVDPLVEQYSELRRGLQAMIASLERLG